MPKDNGEMKDYSIWYYEKDGVTKAKWFGSQETLERENPGIKIIRKRKLKEGWRSKTN